MNRNQVKQAAVLTAVIATIVVNSLANILPFNGQTTGEISDRFEVYFTPAGYVFSIWALIYVGLIVYGIYQALPSQRENPRLQAIAWPFVLSSLGNISWIFFWHYEIFALTIVSMLALLSSLIWIFLRLRRLDNQSVSRGERLFVRLPFSIYLSWITVATIANLTAVLFYYGWNGGALSPQIWTAIMLAAAVVIAALVTITQRDTPFLLVLAWAFAGIAVKHAGVALVSPAAWAATEGVILLIGVGMWLRIRQGLRIVGEPYSNTDNPG